MQLVGEPVKHNTFGPGIITDFTDHIITICFSQGDKKFIYPDAFANFLTLKNESIQREINTIWNSHLQEKNAQKQIVQDEQERCQRIRALKVTPSSQAAFHIDGKGVDEIFSLGTLSSGYYLSGHSKGSPRIPIRLRPNSACILTECLEHNPNQRQIVGAFMVQDDFLGNQCVDGLVKIHDQHRICLQENNRLMFWDYFDHGDETPRWGGSVFKYVANDRMQQILFDIKKTLTGTEDEPRIHEFYEYFCEMNRLPDIQSNDSSDAPSVLR